MPELQPLPPRISPVEAEFQFLADTSDAWTGRLHGPKCRYATTVQIAYPLQQLRGVERGWRVVIPEPSLWEPETPFLYEGVLEPMGTPAEAIYFRQGLRRVQTTPRGLVLNGRPIHLRGTRVGRLEFQHAMQLREAGINLVLTPLDEATKATCALADQIGFFVMAAVDNSETWPDHVERLGQHPSLLAWATNGARIKDSQRLIARLDDSPGEADIIVDADGVLRGQNGFEIGRVED